jgi:hypothetical protein
VKKHPPISTDIREDDVTYGFKKLKETTLTSPSRRHLGYYKNLLLKCLTQALQVTVQSGLTLRRWCYAVNILIEKDPGKPKISQFCIIHLFEADINLFLKLTWGAERTLRIH